MKIGIITIYSDKSGRGSRISAMAWYTKNLLDSMPLESKKEIVILASINEKPKHFSEGGIEVIECWRRNKTGYWLDIIHEIKKHPNLEIIHLQHEFNLFGGVITIPLSILLFLVIKLFLKKKLIITMHGVISTHLIDTEFTKISDLPPLPTLIKMIFYSYYLIVGKIADHFIVHEKKFQKIMKEEFKIKKPISVIPIGIEQKDEHRFIAKNEAKKKLGLSPSSRVLIFFGFLAKYKGLDMLIDAFELLRGPYILIIAGGKPKRLENDKQYNLWFNKLYSRIEKNSKIKVVGYILDEEIEVYFRAADLSIYPYLLPLSASGAITHSIVFNTPFIASEAFAGIIDNEYLFKTNGRALSVKVDAYFNNKTNTIRDYMYQLKTTRRWKNSALETEKIYFNKGGV